LWKNIFKKIIIEGHYDNRGQTANKMKNPLWKVIKNEKEYLLMYCEKILYVNYVLKVI
jgi:hypothetical protein